MKGGRRNYFSFSLNILEGRREGEREREKEGDRSFSSHRLNFFTSAPSPAAAPVGQTMATRLRECGGARATRSFFLSFLPPLSVRRPRVLLPPASRATSFYDPFHCCENERRNERERERRAPKRAAAATAPPTAPSIFGELVDRGRARSGPRISCPSYYLGSIHI